MALGNRMIALVACFFVVALTSGNYAFSVYSGALKHSLKLTQDQTDSIATYPYIAGLFTWLPGMLNDRAGPRATTMLGAGSMGLMLALYWAVATRQVSWDPVTSLVAIGFGSTLANGAITGAIFCSIVKNFPMERGAVVGIAKAWVGLCGGILTQLYVGFIGKPDNSKGTLNFVLMMAGAAMFAALVPSAFVVIHRQRAVEEAHMWARLGFCYVVVLGMAALVTVAALIGDGLAADDRRMFAIGIVCLLLSPITITLPIFDALDSRQPRSGSGIQESLLNPTAGTEEDDNAEDEKRRVAAENAMLPVHNTLKMISGVDCWLLWIGVAALAGGGQLVSANVNQMCESLGYGRAAVAVSLFAVGNGLGRILAGSLSEVIHQARLAPRPLNLFFATIIMGLAHLLFWLDLGIAGLYVGVFLAAFAFGATWPLTVVVTSELWGTKHHGANYLFFDGSTAGIATPFLAKWVAQTFYTSHIHGVCAVVNNGTAPVHCHGDACAACGGTSLCVGVDCFQNAHAVAGGLAACGALCLLAVTVRNRSLYDRIWGYEDEVASATFDSVAPSLKTPISRQSSGAVRV